MNILYASSEIAPFAKTGGLADVGGALPVELAKLGHNVSLFMPAFRQIHQCGQPIESTGIELDVPIGGKVVRGRLLASHLPNSNVRVFMVDQPRYYDRAGIYGEQGGSYDDNCERFVYFNRAVLESIRLMGLSVDLLQCNDWQTGLLPAYLKTQYAHTPRYRDIATVMTIHNLAYQGSFWHHDMVLTGLDWKYFNWEQMECFGQLNLLKTGIVFSDMLSTVSRRYAQEIQGEELGCGLDGTLRARHDRLWGIINGVDYGVWNPATDPHLPQQFDVDSWVDGKRACKLALQEELGLPRSADTPLIGLVGRLADQKGWNLVAEVMQRWVVTHDAQWVILGTGQIEYEELLTELAERHGDKVAAQLTFSDSLAHRIEAAADMFIMPSHYEPCGLNQLYSLKYGAVPVVRTTGGLADTITDSHEETLSNSSANGFRFDNFCADELEAALNRAYVTLTDHPETWRQIVETGMQQDWSWGKSAVQYERLFEQAILHHREGGGT